MPSSYKTEHLGLNRWIGSDKPKRADFNDDNTLIDTAFAEHLADHTAHATQEEKELWNEPFAAGSYTGDNAASRTISLGFTPRAVCVSAVGIAPISMNLNGEVFVRSGFATAFGSTKAVELTQDGFSVRNAIYTPPDGETPKLNMNNIAYIYLAWK